MECRAFLVFSLLVVALAPLVCAQDSMIGGNPEIVPVGNGIVSIGYGSDDSGSTIWYRLAPVRNGLVDFTGVTGWRTKDGNDGGDDGGAPTETVNAYAFQDSFYAKDVYSMYAPVSGSGSCLAPLLEPPRYDPYVIGMACYTGAIPPEICSDASALQEYILDTYYPFDVMPCYGCDPPCTDATYTRDTTDSKFAHYRGGQILVGWDWAADTDGGWSGDDTWPDNICEWQQFANVGNLNGKSAWGSTGDGTCSERSYNSNMLYGTVQAPAGYVFVALGLSLSDDADVAWVRGRYRYPPRCYTDADCNDNDAATTDRCNLPGQWSGVNGAPPAAAYCTNTRAGCGSEGTECCASGDACDAGLWCDDLIAFDTTYMGSIHGAPGRGLCCDDVTHQVAKFDLGSWQCVETNECGPETPATVPPVFPAIDGSEECLPLQACCAGIVQTGPSSFDPMCIPAGETMYNRDFVVY